MALVDVSRPVVINATTEIPRENSDHLRRVCLVSLGWTNLETDSFKEIYAYNWKTLDLGYTEYSRKCESFFSQANLKPVVVLELGKQTGTPLANSYDVLLTYCETFNQFNLVSFYKYIFDGPWVGDQTATGKGQAYTKNVLVAFYNSINPTAQFDVTSYETWCNLNQKDPDEVSTYEEYFDVLLDKDWRDELYLYLAANNDGFKKQLTLVNLTTYVTGLTGENAFFKQYSYDIYLEEHGTKDSDYSAKVEKLNEHIKKAELPSYIYVLPKGMGNYDCLSEELFAQYSGLNQPIYFFLGWSSETPSAFATSMAFEETNKQKSAALFLDNTTNSDLSAAVAGLFASHKFDLNSTNPASPFNYKAIPGTKIKNLDAPTKNELIQNSVNFMDSIAHQNVLLNGRYGDEVSIDYRYQWDLTSFQIEADLKQLILNGVNNPLYVIKYNQNGIDIIKSRVKSTLNNMISLGAVTEYAKGLDPADGSLQGLGDISVIPFREYISQRPEDYKNEIYGGISFYLRIGRYIKQVVLNITLG